MVTKKYKDFPKADARCCFVALLALDCLHEANAHATVHYVAQKVGCSRVEVQRALKVAELQFGVQYGRDKSRYWIVNWGVLKKNEIALLVKSDEMQLALQQYSPHPHQTIMLCYRTIRFA